MHKFAVVWFFFLSGLTVFAADAGARPVLNVYTYDSFASKWGPGPKIKAAFESRCDCKRG